MRRAVTSGGRGGGRPAMRHAAVLIAVGVTPVAIPVAAGAQGVAPSGLRLADATRIADAAVKLAVDGPPVAVVIVNAEGRTITSQRMDGASFINLEAAEQKARTAAGLGEPTKQTEQELAHGGLSLIAIPGLLPMAGGVPLLSKGRVVGAIGVSGREPPDDDLLAVKAQRVFNGDTEGKR